MLHVVYLISRFVRAMDSFLGADGLKNYRVLDKDLPTRGEKSNDEHGENDWFKQKKLNHMLDEQKVFLQEPRVERLSYLAMGEWDPELQMVKVSKPNGKCLNGMGTMLLPEEALFLMDMKRMEVYYNRLPLSIQEAFGIFLQDEQTILNYQVYSHLCRLGYTVVKHTNPPLSVTPTEYEKKINLHLYSSAANTKKESLGAKHSYVPECDGSEVSTSNSLASEADPTEVIQPSSQPPRASPASRFLPCLLARYPDIRMPDVYGKSCVVLEPPPADRHLLPPNVPVSRTSVTLNLERLYSSENLRHRQPTNYNNRKRRREDDDYSMAAKLMHRGYSDEEEVGKRNRMCNPNRRESGEFGCGDFRRSDNNQSTTWNRRGRGLAQNNSWIACDTFQGDEQRGFRGDGGHQGGRGDADMDSRNSHRSHGGNNSWHHRDLRQGDQPRRGRGNRRRFDHLGQDSWSSSNDYLAHRSPNRTRYEQRSGDSRDYYGGGRYRERSDPVSEERGGRSTIASDRQWLPVQVPSSQCRTEAKCWAQYKLELGTASDRQRPACKTGVALLSTEKIAPLVQPKNATSTEDILKKLRIIPQIGTTKYIEKSDHPNEQLLSISYDVYLPNTKYSKKVFFPPDHRLIVLSCFDDLPNQRSLAITKRSLGDEIPIHFAVVESGDIAFYSFKDISLPVQIST